MPNIQNVPNWLATGSAEVVDFSMRGGAPQQEDVHADTEIASRAIRPECLRFGSVGLHPDFDPMNETHIDQVCRRLWTLLEEPGVSTVPSDFRQHHLVRTIPHAIAVWNRRGIVFGWKSERGSQIAAQVRGHLAGLARLSAAVKRLIDESGSVASDERVSLGEKLLPEVLAIELAAASPENRALRRFLEATGFNTLLKSIHGLHLQASTQQSARAVHESVGAIEKTQAKVEWVEIFVVAVYSIYLTNYLGERFEFRDGYIGCWILGGSAASAAIAAFLLRPWKTEETKKDTDQLPKKPRESFKLRALFVLSLIIVLITVYVWLGFVKFHRSHP